jgi:acetoin utilization deacetylase AcuC-like enzyme
MSLHRHDHGSFYPGKSGSHLNVGQGAAEGRQVNIPWNTYGDKDEEYYKVVPGDNEYIYVFERVLYPVLKEFKP